MSYAHLEGFVKQALSTYADHINHTGMPCGDLSEPIAASTLVGELRILRNPIMVSAGIRAFAAKRLEQARRETDFVSTVRALDSAPVALPVDEVVSLESNLNYDVFQRILYRLGLDFDVFSCYASQIAFLVNTRNDIAHGRRTDNIPEAKFRAATTTAIEIMEELTRLLYDAARDRSFCR